jgi:hypothetical protein
MPDATSTIHLPDDFECFDRNSLKRSVIEALSGDLSFHAQIQRSLSRAGFHVARIEKHWFHNVYELRMRRGAAMRDDTENQLRRTIRRALKAESIAYDKETFVVSVQGQMIICAFCYQLGAEGVI